MSKPPARTYHFRSPTGEPMTMDDQGLVAAPGLLEMAGNFARSALGHVADGLRVASPEVQAERERTCRACPLLDQSRDRCTRCGCSAMGLKRSWASEACPDGHWPAV